MMSDIQIIQKQYSAGSTFKLKDSNILFYILAIDWIGYKIEYRRKNSYGHNERFFGDIDDINMSMKSSVAWRNLKIDNLISQ